MTHPNHPHPPRPCASCGHPTLSSRQLRKLPTPRTVRARRGDVCRRCARNPNTVRADQVPGRVAVEEWHFLHDCGELNRADPLTVRLDQAAPRIGMNPGALAKALERAA